MDDLRFDEFTKAMAKGSTRRAVLTSLAAGLAGAVLGSAGMRRADAKPLSRGSTCSPPDDPCGGGERPCCGSLPCVAGVCCPPGRTCGSVCCPGGTKCCAGQCIPDEACCTHADCDDGNACTVDLCGPTSHQCHHIPISDGCVQCTGDAECAGGSCCHGRCCPAGAGCQLAPTGEPVCCPDCGLGVSCCDKISYACGAESCGYEIGAAHCSYGQDTCASCPPLCTTDIAGYREVGPGGTCGDGNVCSAIRSSPVGAIS